MVICGEKKLFSEEYFTHERISTTNFACWIFCNIKEATAVMDKWFDVSDLNQTVMEAH
jgi:hypothetical protein